MHTLKSDKAEVFVDTPHHTHTHTHTNAHAHTHFQTLGEKDYFTVYLAAYS